MKCQRCRKETNMHTMSYFNTQEICVECDEAERKHPEFEKARKAEHDQVGKGNYNFAGIGLPADLK